MKRKEKKRREKKRKEKKNLKKPVLRISNILIKIVNRFQAAVLSITILKSRC
jgi:hypothetical protein